MTASNIGTAQCRCMTPPFHFSDFTSVEVGIDRTKSRFGEVTLETCKHCGTVWLRYFVEYEYRSGSGRWYRGQIDTPLAAKLTPENAVAILEALPEYFYGGSYFGSTGSLGCGQVFVDAH